ncbi:hypothetical protein D3C73_1237160 [compost metagenome]
MSGKGSDTCAGLAERSGSGQSIGQGGIRSEAEVQRGIIGHQAATEYAAVQGNERARRNGGAAIMGVGAGEGPFPCPTLDEGTVPGNDTAKALCGRDTG